MTEIVGLTTAPDVDPEYRLHRRFDRLGRLYGDRAVKTLMDKRVVIFGLGGVGSFAAEALARSAVGHLMLVDFDDVCITNGNRQLQAMQGMTGKPKCEVLRDRLRKVNPQAQIESLREFYSHKKSDELLTPPWGKGNYDFVLDCVDNITAKCHLLATCRERGIPLITSMGAAGKMDPTQIRIADLADTEVCRLARDVRRVLRRNHDFPRTGQMGIPAVYSTEARSWPKELTYDGGEGFKCICPNRSPEHGCDSRALIDGTAVFVTGSFGMTMASHVVKEFTKELMDDAPEAISQKGTTKRDRS